MASNDVDMPLTTSGQFSDSFSSPLSMCSKTRSEAVPVLPSTSSNDSGYPTHHDSFSTPARSNHPSWPVFNVEEDDDELYNLDEVEMDDDVFEEEEEESPARSCGVDFVDRPLPAAVRSVVPMRTRAFSFPFTLTDIRFSLTFPVSDAVLQQPPSPFFSMHGSRTSPLSTYDINSYEVEEIGKSNLLKILTKNGLI